MINSTVYTNFRKLLEVNKNDNCTTIILVCQTRSQSFKHVFYNFPLN